MKNDHKSNKFVVRKASLDDLKDVLLLTLSLHEQHSFTGEFNLEWKRKYLSDAISDSSKKIFVDVAIVTDNLVGYAIAYLDKVEVVSSEKCHLNEIFVKKDYRKMGIGHSLVQTIIDWTENMGVFEITTNVAVDNPFKACKLLENFGFRPRSICLVKKVQ